MFGKKGYLRTVEAVMAIIILLGLILYTFNTGQDNLKLKIPESVDSANTFIINEFLNNAEYRSCFEQVDLSQESPGLCNIVLINKKNKNADDCVEVINKFLENSAPNGYSVDCEICKTPVSCSNSRAPLDKSVYPRSGIISLATSSEKEIGNVIRIYTYEKSFS